MRAATLPFYVSIVAVVLGCNAYSHLSEKQTRTDLAVKNKVLSAKNKVRECIFRYQISKFGVSDRDYNKHFFVGIGYQPKDDPAPEVIARLQSRAYSVNGISHCRCSTGGVSDSKTHARGLAFIVSKMKFVSRGHVQVRASFFKSGKSGNDAIYIVDNTQGAWKVTKCQITETY